MLHVIAAADAQRHGSRLCPRRRAFDFTQVQTVTAVAVVGSYLGSIALG